MCCRNDSIKSKGPCDNYKFVQTEQRINIFIRAELSSIDLDGELMSERMAGISNSYTSASDEDGVSN